MRKLFFAALVGLSCSVVVSSIRAQTPVPKEDCIRYDPATLTIKDMGLAGWTVVASKKTLLVLDTREDAQAALDIVKRFSAQCFVGRSNKRPNRLSYIMQYWK